MPTKIEWTKETINPTMGCSLQSAGCEHCYAMRQAFRLEKMRIKGYEGTTKKLKSGKIVWTGKINFDIEKLRKAVNRKTPTMFFVNSMSDLFHPNVPFTFIDSVYEIMGYHTQHIFQILTKQPKRALEYYNWTSIFKAWGEWKHIWLGVSVEDQETADERIPILMKIPAAVKFLSIEPMLGPVDILESMSIGLDAACEHYLEHSETFRVGIANIDWIICGGESGPGARPMASDWVRSIRDHCLTYKKPFFFKQWGEFIPKDQIIDWDKSDLYAKMDFIKQGKKHTGNILDGVVYNEFPKV